MINTSTLISQMLAPSVAISAFGLLLLSMNNRFFTITGRIRSLNAEIRDLNRLENRTKFDNRRIQVVKDQVGLMLKRCNIIKNAVFFLYMGMGCTVLTVLMIASDILDLNLGIEVLAIKCFVIALFLMLTAIILEGYEVRMALKTVNDDFINSCCDYIESISNENKPSE